MRVVCLETSESPEKGKKTLKTFNLVGLFQKGRKRRYSSVHRNQTEIYMKKKIYLADLFRKAADENLMPPSDFFSDQQEMSRYSCSAVMTALDSILDTNAAPWNVVYKKSWRLKNDYQLYPTHYKILDWMTECGVKCGSCYNFKNSESSETQYVRFMWLEMMALIAEDEGTFIEYEVKK